MGFGSIAGNEAANVDHEFSGAINDSSEDIRPTTSDCADAR